MPVSVLILTLNEETNLPRLLESVRGWSHDIVVLDSGSTDRTVEIASSCGARVFSRRWEAGKEHEHRNYALHEIPYQNEWIYIADADESLTDELKREINETISDHPMHVGYWVRYKNIYNGKWIKHSSLYPTWVLRLVKPREVSYPPRGINMHALPASGTTGRLNSHFLHFSFHKGISHWIWKHNEYSSAEAAETIAQLSNGAMPWRDLLSGDSVRRRKALKLLSFRMPFRPLLKFTYMYVIRRGFLDGAAGFSYCLLQSFYEYMIVLKTHELKSAPDKTQMMLIGNLRDVREDVS